MSASQRKKGQRGENNVCKAYKQLGIFPDARRNLNDFNEARGIDLAETGNLAHQIKHYKNHVSISKINEIKPTGNQIPVLISWPTNRKDKPTVTVFFDDWLRILDDIGVVYDDMFTCCGRGGHE